MGWVHIHISHGPGHQSHSDYYEYFNPLKGKICDQVEYFYDQISERMNSPIMNWKFVRKLPASIKKRELEDALFRLKEAKTKVKELESVGILSIDIIEAERKKQKRKFEKLLKKALESHKK